MAQQPLPNYYRKAYQQLDGGLSTRPHPQEVPANKFTQLDNAILADHDILEKARGYVLDGSPFPNHPDSFIRMLVNFRVGTSVNSIVVAAADSGNTNTTYKVDLKQSLGDGTYHYIGYVNGSASFTNGSASVLGTSTLWTKHLKAGDKIKLDSQSVWYEIASIITDTSLTLTIPYAQPTGAGNYMARLILANSATPVGLVFNNNLVIADGQDKPIAFDGTTVTVIQDPQAPKGPLLERHKNRVFACDSAGNLAWSNVNDETSWEPESITSVFPNDNGATVQIKSFANSLLVFKDNGLVYKVIGEFDQDQAGHEAAILRIDTPDNLGIIAGKTVVVGDDNNCYFLAETGVYAIDPYMRVFKLSWDIEPTVTNLIVRPTATADKQFPFTARSQWETGTLSGLSLDRVTNGISTFFDSQTITGVHLESGCISAALDPNNNDVHIAYIDSATALTIKHVKVSSVDNTVTSETIPNTTGGIVPVGSAPHALAIGVAPNGNIGVCHKYAYGPDVGNTHQGNAYYLFSEFASGSWTTTKAYSTPPTDENVQGHGVQDRSYQAAAYGINVLYDGSNNPSILVCNGGGSTFSGGVTFYEGQGCAYAARSGGIWTTKNGYFGPLAVNSNVSGVKDGSGNLYALISAISGSSLSVWKSTNGGVSWSQIGPYRSVASAGNVPSAFLTIDGTNSPIVTYNYLAGAGAETGKIIKWNPVANTTETIENSGVLRGFSSYTTDGYVYYETLGTTEVVRYESTYTDGTAVFTNGSSAVAGTGTKWTSWVQPGDVIKLLTDVEGDFATVLTVNSDTSITLTGNYNGTSTGPTPAAYVSKRTRMATSDTGLLYASNQSNNQCISNNGPVICTVQYGSSANTLVMRRMTLVGRFDSPLLNDPTLTAWGTYAITGAISGGNEIVYEAGTSATGTPTAAQSFLVTPGQVLSTDNTKFYVKTDISFFLEAFSPSSVQSLVINYVGAGSSPSTPYAYVFNNEVYFSTSKQGQSFNEFTLFFDRRHAWGDFDLPIGPMARRNLQMYGGSSTNGDVYLLRTGYTHDGEAYTLTATTKEDMLGSLELTKEVYKAYLLFQTKPSGTFTFSYRLDNYKTPTGSSWTDAVVDQTVDGVFEVPIGQNCSSIQFKITQADADVQLGFIGFTVLYSYLNLR